MTVQEILNAAQVMTFEERKKLIQGLFVQMPHTAGLAGTISDVDNFDAGKRELRQCVQESLERTARELNSESEEA